MFVSRSFDRGLQYAKRGSHYTNALSIRKVLEYPQFLVCDLLVIYHVYHFFIKKNDISTATILYRIFMCSFTNSIYRICWTLNSNFRTLTQFGVTDGEVTVWTWTIWYLIPRMYSRYLDFNFVAADMHNCRCLSRNCWRSICSSPIFEGTLLLIRNK